MSSRAEQIARIKQLERIRELEAQQGITSGGDTSGSESTDQGIEEPSARESAFDYGLKGLGAVGKILDLPRGVTSGPLLALALKGITGKDVASMKEYSDTVNPTNLGTFPTAAEMFKRAGVPEGGKLSDILPGYSEPGTGGFLRPEKGGFLDPTLRGTGGTVVDFLSDPLNVFSMGASGAAKKGIQESASRVALDAARNAEKGVAGKVLDMAARPLEAANEKVTNVLAMPAASGEFGSKANKVLQEIASFPSRQLKKVGKKIYESPIQAVEHEGAKYGKQDVAEALYNAGVSNPLTMRKKADKAVGTLMDARNQIFDEAEKAGAKVNMNESMKAAQDEVNRLRSIKDSDAHALADRLQAKIDEYSVRSTGTPDIPEQIIQDGFEFNHITQSPEPKFTVVPGKKGVAPQPYTPKEASDVKTFLYNDLPNSTFHQDLKTPVGKSVQSKMAKGFKEGTENSVADVLGTQKGYDVAELNDTAGKLLGTKKAQTRVQNQYDRIKNNVSTISGTDTVIGGIGGLKAMAAKKAMDTLRLLTMPGGYGLRRISESSAAPLIDAYARQKFKGTVLPMPYDKDQGEE